MCQKVKGLMGIICQASKIASQETKKKPNRLKSSERYDIINLINRNERCQQKEKLQ